MYVSGSWGSFDIETPQWLQASSVAPRICSDSKALQWLQDSTVATRLYSGSKNLQWLQESAVIPTLYSGSNPLQWVQEYAVVARVCCGFKAVHSTHTHISSMVGFETVTAAFHTLLSPIRSLSTPSNIKSLLPTCSQISFDLPLPRLLLAHLLIMQQPAAPFNSSYSFNPVVSLKVHF